MIKTQYSLGKDTYTQIHTQYTILNTGKALLIIFDANNLPGSSVSLETTWRAFNTFNGIRSPNLRLNTHTHTPPHYK